MTRISSSSSNVNTFSSNVDLLSIPGTSDWSNGQRFILFTKGCVHYCPQHNSWMIWDGKVWIEDDLSVRRLAVEAMQEYERQATAASMPNSSTTPSSVISARKAKKHAEVSCNSTPITNMLREAKAYLQINAIDFDREPFLLNVENGIINTNTKELSPHDPSWYITKMVHYPYNPNASCEFFMQYLKDITGWPKPIVLKSFSPYNTKEEEEAFKKIEAENLKAARKAQIRSTNLINYLQKALGYSLTSDTSERTTFIAYGPTKTGKSTLLNTIKEIIREYSGKLMVTTLFNKYDSLTAQANLAGLKGARFAMCSELPKSDDDSSIKLNSQIIKHLVQGSNSTMVACKKGENPIEFLQTHKIWIDTNFLPDFKGDDEALWNRLTPIPFMTQFEGSEDKYLYQRLLDEAEGILAWLIEGAYKWRQEGLIPPPEIQEAINEWRLAKDPILRFVNQCCVTGPNKKCKARRLYNAYKQWSEENEVEAISLTAFGLKISSLGYIKKKISDIIYLGIGLTD